MHNKEIFLTEIIKELRERAAKLSDAARVSHEEAVCAPTPMESHSDRTRFEMQTAYAKQSAMAGKYEDAIKTLQRTSLSETPPHSIEVGSLVTIEREGAKMYYFILPEGNGIVVEVGGEKCAVVTPGSPLGGALIGKAKGQEFVFGSSRSFNGKVKEIV